jgi:uncharacterized protein
VTRLWSGRAGRLSARQATGSAELREVIDSTPWVDVHEHLVEERHRLKAGDYTFADGLGNQVTVAKGWRGLLLGGLVFNDLRSAGLPNQTARLILAPRPDSGAAWDLLHPYLTSVRLGGYMRAVDATTERLFGCKLTRDTCESIDRRLDLLQGEGYYARVLQSDAGVERCQVNSLDCDPFCAGGVSAVTNQDLSITALVRGYHQIAERASGIEVGDLDDYIALVEWVYATYASAAVAVKCYWAYFHPQGLRFHSTDMPTRAFARVRRGVGSDTDRFAVEECVFRYCLQQAARYRLPVKLHCGYLAGNDDQSLGHSFLESAGVTQIVQAYPETDFVLMHTGWPSQEYLVALAKHQPNVYLDMSWAWALAPVAAADWLARCLTSVPTNKILCFGGDYLTVETVVGHAHLARRGLQQVLQFLVGSDWLTIDEAVALAPALMRDNADRVLPAPS